MMHGADSNEIDSDSKIDANTSMDQQFHVRKVDCVIIGAGAAGLQCAAMLLEGRNSSVSTSQRNKKDMDSKDDSISLVVLEARERIGGRIFTTHEKTRTVGQKDEVLLCRDHGAAWVHGIHESNPMMELLADADDQSDSAAELAETTTDQQSSLLNPVFDGNPWIRPHTVLHRNGRKGENSLISFFVNGKRIPDETNSYNDENKNVSNDPSILPTLSVSSLSSIAVRRHYRLLREIIKDNSDECECDDNVDSLYKELNNRLDGLSTKDEEDQKLVNLLTPFYLYLMENWNGISMKETEVDQVEDFITPHQQCDEEEEKCEHSESSTTDEEYVSAGDFIGPHCKVKTGMFTVLKPLIRTLEGHKRHDDTNKILALGEEVISIIDKQTHIQIETKSGTMIETKCCVSTLPLGCLQHSISIQNESPSSSSLSTKPFFQPRLRHDKIEAIHSIWSGAYKKVFLTFDHVFWPREPPIIGLVRREGSSLGFPGQYLLLYNLWARDGNIPSVEAILCGDLGKWAFEKPDTLIKQAVIEFMEAAMGLSNLHDSCIGCHVTRWEEDEFTRGSYSAFQLGTLDEHVEELGSTEWDGRLVFAGEATENDHMGSVHAALMSGKRAAKQVSGLLNSATTSH